ncbi:N-6 DNA methylase [Streptomyces cremeus]|uniref:N-6 DNA methylase n=1 Tax=Streptomyces cremeus TaxID=66881 RepID=A0ABV5P5B6_STRCM
MSASSLVPVSLAGIARVAGVGRAAVSNWRRRHDTFPERIGGSDTSPQFSLTEVEGWLRDSGKLPDGHERELLWLRFEALGSRAEAGLAIATSATAASATTASPRPASAARMTPPDAATAELSAAAAALGEKVGRREIFEFLLRRWLEINARQLSATPPPLASLMTWMALSAYSPDSDRLTVLDPACGTGHLLSAAADLAADGYEDLTLLGCEIDPAQSALATTRLDFAARAAERSAPVHAAVDIRTADALREDPWPVSNADIALCNPPFSERDWGHDELATDARWTHGLPPRTEPELAWVQHLLAHLKPGGTAVVVLPPAVAARKAGRRIRGSLVRTGTLRTVVALPPGCAQPHGVSLQLWLLNKPAVGTAAPQDVLFVDASHHIRGTARDSGPDWDALSQHVRAAVERLASPPSQELPARTVRVPVIDLLDDEVDVTPGRHTSAGTAPAPGELPRTWDELRATLERIGRLSETLSALVFKGAGSTPTVTVGDLARAQALEVRAGQQSADDSPAPESVLARPLPMLTIQDLLLGEAPRLAVDPAEEHTVAEKGDVIVVGVDRLFRTWVHQDEPVALGPQLYRLRVDPTLLDAHFLAGCLRAPANRRQAGTHASSSSRIDVRRLQVPQLPVADQVRLRASFRDLADFDTMLEQVHQQGKGLIGELSDRLASGDGLAAASAR